jgi:hypothetical protein
MPWSRRDATSSHNMSSSRSRSRADRVQAGTHPGGISMQIQIERYTQPPLDDHDINLARKKSTASGITDTSSFASIPPAVPGGGGEDFSRGYRESKVEFDFTGARPTRQGLPTNSPAPNTVVVPYPGYQEQYSMHPLSPPRAPVHQQEQDHSEEHAYPGTHPYSLA